MLGMLCKSGAKLGVLVDLQSKKKGKKLYCSSRYFAEFSSISFETKRSEENLQIELLGGE